MTTMTPKPHDPYDGCGKCVAHARDESLGYNAFIAERGFAAHRLEEAGFTVTGGGMMVGGPGTGQWDVFILDPDNPKQERGFSTLAAVEEFIRSPDAPVCECGRRAFVDESGDYWVCRTETCPGVGQVLRPVGFGPMVVITADGITAQGYLGRDDVLRLAPVKEAK